MACTLSKELKAQFTAGLTTLEATDAPDAEIKTLHKAIFILSHYA